MLSMVSPGGSSKRLTGMILTLMTLCVLFRPVAAAGEWALQLRNYSFDEAEVQNSALEAEVEQSAKSVYATYLAENLCRVLDGAGISYKSIDVTMDELLERAHNQNFVPVTDARGTFIGIVTRQDIIRHFVK